MANPKFLQITLSLDSGVDWLGINLTNNKSGSYYVDNITRGGAVDLDGRIRVGDKLLMVNDIVLSNMDASKVVRVLRRVEQGKGKIRLLIEMCKDSDKPEEPAPKAMSNHGTSERFDSALPSLDAERQRGMLKAIMIDLVESKMYQEKVIKEASEIQRKIAFNEEALVDLKKKEANINQELEAVRADKNYLDPNELNIKTMELTRIQELCSAFQKAANPTEHKVEESNSVKDMADKSTQPITADNVLDKTDKSQLETDISNETSDAKGKNKINSSLENIGIDEVINDGASFTYLPKEGVKISSSENDFEKQDFMSTQRSVADLILCDLADTFQIKNALWILANTAAVIFTISSSVPSSFVIPILICISILFMCFYPDSQSDVISYKECDTTSTCATETTYPRKEETVHTNEKEKPVFILMILRQLAYCLQRLPAQVCLHHKKIICFCATIGFATITSAVTSLCVSVLSALHKFMLSMLYCIQHGFNPMAFVLMVMSFVSVKLAIVMGNCITNDINSAKKKGFKDSKETHADTEAKITKGEEADQTGDTNDANKEEDDDGVRTIEFSVTRAGKEAFSYCWSCSEQIDCFESNIEVEEGYLESGESTFVCEMQGIYTFSWTGETKFGVQTRITLLKNDLELTHAMSNGQGELDNAMTLTLENGDKICLKVVEQLLTKPLDDAAEGTNSGSVEDKTNAED